MDATLILLDDNSYVLDIQFGLTPLISYTLPQAPYLLMSTTLSYRCFRVISFGYLVDFKER